MVSLTTRVDEIYWVEGFKIVVEDDEEDRVWSSRHGVLGPYRWTKRLSDNKTVADWKKLRFRPIDPTHTCKVVLGDGTPANDSVELGFVRSQYA